VASEKRSTPQFNSGIHYLFSLRDLMDHYHTSYIMKNYERAFHTLNQIQTELRPRLTEGEVRALNCLREKCRNGCVHYLRDRKGVYSMQFSMLLTEWFENLNGFAHANGLIMPDKADFLEGQIL